MTPVSVTEKNALIRAKGATGDSFLIYPITKAENVDGLDELFTGKADTTHNHDSVYDTIGSADAALTEAKTYVENYTFITTNDIDEICGANIVAASEVIF